MFKWILGVAVVALLVGIAVWQRNAVKTTYVNGLPPYTSLPGRQYVFERNCYIFKLKGRDTSWPLVGAHQTVPELPDAFDTRNIGADLPGVRILDVARIGDRFRIVSVRQDSGRTGTSTTFEILFLDEASRAYPRLDAYWILDHAPEKTGAAPEILPTYAVRQAIPN